MPSQKTSFEVTQKILEIIDMEPIPRQYSQNPRLTDRQRRRVLEELQRGDA